MNILTIIQSGLPFLGHYGLLIVFLGALIEGETVIVLAGVLCHQGTLPFLWTIVAATMGAFVGDQTWFRLGRRYGTDVLLHFPRLAKHAARVRPWLQRSSDWIAAGSRFVYGTRTVSPLLLGAHAYPGIRFAIINLISAGLWAGLGVGAGFLVGTGAEQILGRIKHIELLLLVVLVMMLCWWWYRHTKLAKGSPGNRRGGSL